MAASVKPSPGRKSDKQMRDALVVALHRECEVANGKPTKRLYVIADKLAQKAAEGDVVAIKEVFDRVDGKSVQQTDMNLNPSGSLLDWLASLGDPDEK